MTDHLPAEISREDFLAAVFAAVSDRTFANPEKFQKLLDLGRAYLRVDSAILSGFDAGVYKVRQISCSHTAVGAGDSLLLDETLCLYTVRNQSVTVFTHAGAEEPGSHPNYRTFVFETYIGAPIRVEGRIVGTLCFESLAPRATPFTPDECEIVASLAAWISERIECELMRGERDLLVTSAPVHYLRLRPDRRIARANQTVADLAGLDRGALAGQPLGQVFPAIDAVYDDLSNSVATDSVAVIPAGGSTGEARRLKLCGVPFANVAADEIDTIILGMDVTRLEDQARELECMNAALIRSNDDLKMLNQIAAHDLQEPLRKIKLFTDIFLDAAAAGDREEMARAKQTLDIAASRGQDLVSALLSLRRISDCEMDCRPIALEELIRSAMETLSERIAECGARVHMDVAGLEIRADPVLAPHLFQNLLSNALSFRRAAEPPRVRISAVRSETGLTLVIADNGIGFDADLKERMFAPFTRLNPAADPPGTGVGLAVVARVARRHGWGISAESAPGAGSVFSLFIPAR